MVNVADLMITSLDTITAYSLAGVPRFMLDELQDATIANTEEKTDLTGKQGRKIGSLKKNKGVTVSGTNGILAAGMLEVQVGAQFAHKESTPVDTVDYLTITNNAATTEFKGVGTEGAEIRALYIVGTDGVASEKLTQGAEVGDKVFTYDPDTKALAFKASTYTDGTAIRVFYTRNIEGDVLENLSDKYSEKLSLTIDGTAEDKCGTVYRIQFRIPKADFSGNFDLALGGDQTVHAFEAESLAGSCGGSGALWDYTVFASNAEDAA